MLALVSLLRVIYKGELTGGPGGIRDRRVAQDGQHALSGVGATKNPCGAGRRVRGRVRTTRTPRRPIARACKQSERPSPSDSYSPRALVAISHPAGECRLSKGSPELLAWPPAPARRVGRDLRARVIGGRD